MSGSAAIRGYYFDVIKLMNKINIKLLKLLTKYIAYGNIKVTDRGALGKEYPSYDKVAHTDEDGERCRCRSFSPGAGGLLVLRNNICQTVALQRSAIDYTRVYIRLVGSEPAFFYR